MLAVRWYLRFGLSYRDLEELLAERGVEVDHVTSFRWVQRFTPLLVDAARPCRQAVGARWFVDETYSKVAGRWRYVYRPRRRVRPSHRGLRLGASGPGVGAPVLWSGDHRPWPPDEVVTDPAQALETAIEDLMPVAFQNTDQYANNLVECDRGRLKARLRPMRGLKTDRTARVVVAGHAFMQNLRRGYYELGVEAEPRFRVAAAFDELAETI